MDRHEYANAVNSLQIAAGIIAQLDLPKVLEAISLADAAGPILDPTLYMKGHAKLAEVRRLVEAALPLRAECIRQVDAARKAG